ncbi:hypothetical protein QUB16_28445 [Microcoleus sp. D3_18a_C4]
MGWASCPSIKSLINQLFFPVLQTAALAIYPNSPITGVSNRQDACSTKSEFIVGWASCPQQARCLFHKE